MRQWQCCGFVTLQTHSSVASLHTYVHVSPPELLTDADAHHRSHSFSLRFVFPHLTVYHQTNPKHIGQCTCPSAAFVHPLPPLPRLAPHRCCMIRRRRPVSRASRLLTGLQRSCARRQPSGRGWRTQTRWVCCVAHVTCVTHRMQLAGGSICALCICGDLTCNGTAHASCDACCCCCV
jgi:hypothetical protein